MNGPSVSVVVASRGRPEALSLCLTALGQLVYHPFEVIVVADPSGMAAAQAHHLAGRFKCVPFDEANLSRARNLGIGAAAGEIVAFIDDDAFAEPGWLSHLVAPLKRGVPTGTGGYVIGRNGFSLQWAARSVAPDAQHIDGLEPPEGGAVRTEGTNMALRRDVLAKLGGFDAAYRYFLDDTDLNMRFARAEHRVDIAPKARVWHRQDASPRRGPARAPRNLFEIGASLAVFLARYADDPARALAQHREAERRRLHRHLVQGNLEPRDIPRLIAEFDQGAREGALRKAELAEDLTARAPFKPLHEAPPDGATQVISGWTWQPMIRRAEDAVAQGKRVHVIRLSPTALYHHRRFVEPGIWLQTGGVFGRSNRGDPLIRRSNLRERVQQEAESGPFRFTKSW